MDLPGSKPEKAPVKTPEPKKDNFADPFEELDRLSTSETASKPPEKKQELEKTEKLDEDQELPPEEPKAEDDKQQAKAEEEPKTIKALRAAHDALKKERETLRAEIETLKKSKTTTTEKDSDRSALSDRLTAAEKRRQELEEEIRYINYEKSEEYQKQYEKPMQKAFETAYSDVAELMIETENGPRKATPDDFNQLMRMNLPQAIAQAREWFGDAATEVLAHRRKIWDLNSSRTEALERYRAEGAEREKSNQAKRAQEAEQAQRLWNESNEQAATKFPEFFGPDEADPEGNELLTKGFEMADLAFGDSGSLSPEQRVRLHSMIRNKAAGFDRMVRRNRQLKEKLAAMEKELADFKTSEPGKGDGGQASQGADKDWERELEELAKVR